MTCIVVEVNPAADTVMLPVKVPAVRPAVTILAVKLAGELPEVGETCSQLPPLLVAALTVNAAVVPLEVETATLCPAGVALPVVKLNESAVGVVINTGRAVTFSDTVTTCGLPAACGEVTVMDPV